ncbi:glycosyltransferase family protein [uncultured Cyclobacterium sp.]|uniref:glycosyltransferase family protein n=1 Tax=uncultured Cyclobacterium sp. TaxID=453820 RepID=UPI0030EBCAE8|tara:strand:+ start:129902 stop:131020 length:1119 start_codon:yes stop_codon:yes gene_type:complete
MKFLFIVQGEGRGHMTQAQVLKNVLEKQGHVIVAVILGTSKRRKIPSYFLASFNCPVYSIPSPNFITDKANKSIKLRATIFENLKKSPQFFRTLKQIDHQVSFHQPDGIINFYDILGGLYNLIFRPKTKFIAIGHQYLSFHPDFNFYKQGEINKFLFKLNTKITCHGAAVKIALSLWQPSAANRKNGLKVWPPLVKEIIKKTAVREENFFLAYVVNPGYAQELIQSAKENPDSDIQAFWDNSGVSDPYEALPNLVFHQINESLFLEKMATCKGFLTTAGFESIGEAMYLGKNILMVPVKGQYEQHCNAIDAEKAGAGKASKTFDLKVLKRYIGSLKDTQHKNATYKAWQNSLEEHVFEMVNEISSDEKVNAY